MEIRYQRLTENELASFIEMRINQLREEGAKEDIDLYPALKDYYNRHMADGTFVSWIALDGDKIIGTAECLLWKSRLISAVQTVKSGFFPACLRRVNIGGRELRENSCQG